jgi:hypothetical protein
LAGTLVGITDTRVLVEFVASDDKASRVETRPRGGITQIDYSGPADRWLDATDEMLLPEGCFVTVHFEHSSSLKLPVEPANSYSASQRDLGDALRGLFPRGRLLNLLPCGELLAGGGFTRCDVPPEVTFPAKSL